MAREIVTSENRDDFINKKLNIEPKNAINVQNREIPITIHPLEKESGNKLVNIDTNNFDKSFANNDWQYIGKNGEGGIAGRYEKIKEFLKTAKSMHASNASINEKGKVTFGDGRHRYAYLRDLGMKKIPISMDKESIKNAKKFNYLHNEKQNKE